MKTEFDLAIGAFLAQTEHLRIALQIAEGVVHAADVLHDRFWKAATKMVQERLDAKKIADWVIRPFTGDYSVVGIKIVSRLSGRDGVLLSFAAASDSDDAASATAILQGILLPGNYSKGLDDEIEGVRTLLSDRGYRSDKTGVGWKEIMAFATPNDLLLAIADAVEDRAKVVSGTLWDFFEATKAKVEATNAVLVGKHGQARP